MTPAQVPLWLTLLLFISLLPTQAETLRVPTITGDWWRIAGNPDLGEYTTDRQQPVDFGIWQAQDGTWQLWSCIRNTAVGGNTRLFFRWEGSSLTDTDWQPVGIAMTARPDLGESPGGLQAPHVIRHEGRYIMSYGDWNAICFATSEDGKEFTRIIQPDGKTALFHEGEGNKARDPMILNINGLWYCYYTANPNHGYVYCRTSPDLVTWSHSAIVSYGGAAGHRWYQHECPFVVETRPGLFHLFRNQYYGHNMRNWVYASTNPLQFGIDDDRTLVTTLEVAAPEIIHHEGQYYIASLTRELDGIRIARLDWVDVERPGHPVLDFDSADHRAEWTQPEGDLPTLFTRSTRQNFHPPQAHFIGTAERPDGSLDDEQTGILVSPSFELEDTIYTLMVSGGDRPGVEVAVVETDTNRTLVRFRGTRSNRLEPRLFPANAHAGKTVHIRVTDRENGPWGHINFGGIFRDQPVR